MPASDSTTVRQHRGTKPFTDLQALFDALPDVDLLETLVASRRNGRPGFPVPMVWRVLIAAFFLGIVHDTDLVRSLESNPLLAAVCGINSPDEIPSVFAIGRFRRKLAGFREAVSGVLTACVTQLRHKLPDFGQTVAIDATDVKAWANSFHQSTDPDAGVGAKRKGHLFYWYGYKVHLAVDAASELPIWFDVTAANAYDGSMLAPVLSAARDQFGWFAPEYVTADKGYDAEKSFRFVGEGLGATPIIDVQKSHVPTNVRIATRTKSDFRPCEARPVKDLLGNDRFQCERRPFKRECPVFTSCRWHPRKLRTQPIPEDQHYAQRYSDFAYGSEEWKTVYNKRVSVERVFSRLKGYRKLNSIRTRRLPKVWLHVALSLLTMMGSALSNSDAPRRCVT